MKITQILLLPFSMVFLLFIKLRLWFYQRGFWGKVNFSVPIISIGNIQAGGTGKTPLVEYLCDMLSKDYGVGVLSRGYKRLTYGFRYVQITDDYKKVGDEMFWLKRLHPELSIGVAENRVEGIPNLMSYSMNTELIILDDGYQQLGIRNQLNILLTPYHKPFSKDYLIPMGRLREPKSESRRADILIITKCPPNRLHQKDEIVKELDLSILNNQKVFLSALSYPAPYLMFYEGLIKRFFPTENILLVTGIADAEPLKNYLSPLVNSITHLSYPDHYRYRNTDVAYIAKKYHALKKQKDKVFLITTEKDAVRLLSYRNLMQELTIEFYVQPANLIFDDPVGFQKEIYKVLPDKSENDKPINQG